MTENFNYSRQFHEAFGIPIQNKPMFLSTSRASLRMRLLDEEVEELRTALADGDIMEILDALCDIRVVLDGTVLECGMDSVYTHALREVNRSNMTKLRNVLGEDKIQKGPNFERPNFVWMMKDREEL